MKLTTIIKNICILIFLVSIIGTASADTWTSNTSMKAGILYTTDDMDYYGNEFHPTTFYENDDLKVLFGAVWPVGRKKPGVGWKWESDTWVEDTSIVSGLPNIDDFKPEVFELDNTLYLVGGTGTSGAPNGWKRIGTSWSSYDTIANGLFYPSTEIFWDGDRLKAINYNSMSGKGFYWNGVIWVEDASIINGLSFSSRYGFALFQVENDFKLIQDDYDHSQMDGFQWDSTIWVENSTISSGFGYPDVFQEPEIFVLNGKYHAIVGSNTKINAWSDGDYIAPIPIPTATPTSSPIYIPPPVLPPTPIPPIIPPDEPILEIIIEEFITFISTPFNWLLVLFTYFGALLGKILSDPDNDNTDEILVDTLLYGTIACIIILIINFVVPIITMEKFLVMFIFALAGFLLVSLANLNSEPEKKKPRRKR